MADSESEFIDFFLPFLVATLACPEHPDGPYPSPDKEIVKGVCAALKISESDVWAKIKTHVRPAAGAVN